MKGKKGKGKPRKSPTPKPRKIAILGTTPSRMDAPINDPSWEIWTIGPGGSNAHRWDRLYEIHGGWPKEFDGYMKELRAIKPPRQVVTMKPIADCPANVIYPRETILARYPRRMWFSSSITWCLAQAIDERPTDIGLWGIDLESVEERVMQFIGCAHFIDIARMLGINVHLPSACGLLRDPAPYPDRYETHLSLTLEKKAAWLTNAIATMEPQYHQKMAEVHRKEGELLTLRRLGAKAEEIVEGEKVLVATNVQVGQLAANINQLKGELEATQFYRRMFVYNMLDPDELRIPGT